MNKINQKLEILRSLVVKACVFSYEKCKDVPKLEFGVFYNKKYIARNSNLAYELL